MTRLQLKRDVKIQYNFSRVAGSSNLATVSTFSFESDGRVYGFHHSANKIFICFEDSAKDLPVNSFRLNLSSGVELGWLRAKEGPSQFIKQKMEFNLNCYSFATHYYSFADRASSLQFSILTKGTGLTIPSGQPLINIEYIGVHYELFSGFASENRPEKRDSLGEYFLELFLSPLA